MVLVFNALTSSPTILCKFLGIFFFRGNVKIPFCRTDSIHDHHIIVNQTHTRTYSIYKYTLYNMVPLVNVFININNEKYI